MAIAIFFFLPMLKGKKILLAITGSIAAYKSAWLIRLLVQHGADVKVVVSPSALEFVTPLTLSTLSKHPIYSDFTEDADKGTWTNHVALALWADILVVAPASANTISKMATAQSDNFLLTTYMSARCPVMIAPAMDHDMFEHQGTQHNLEKLTSFGHHILAPKEGELASGLIGKGRMAEPEEITSAIIDYFHPQLLLKNKKVLITAGPTYEPIDPVRYIGNRSTGKMGIELALEAAKRGALVTLVLGPTHLTVAHPSIEVIPVETADEMHTACLAHFSSTDIAIMSAAVADYKIENIAKEKIKKAGDQLQLNLTKNVDIAASLGKIKTHQKLVGFALETTNEKFHALEKLEKKNFDMIVLNSLQDKGAGFGGNTNKISLFWPNNKSKEFGLKAKSEVASDIITEIIEML